MRIDRIKFCTELARKDWTLKQLSEVSGVSRQTLSYVKQGKSCTEDVGKRIITALEVDATELIEN